MNPFFGFVRQQTQTRTENLASIWQGPWYRAFLSFVSSLSLSFFHLIENVVWGFFPPVYTIFISRCQQYKLVKIPEESKGGRTWLPFPSWGPVTRPVEQKHLTVTCDHFGPSSLQTRSQGERSNTAGEAWAGYHHGLLGLCFQHSSTTPGRSVRRLDKTIPLQTKAEVWGYQLLWDLSQLLLVVFLGPILPFSQLYQHYLEFKKYIPTIYLIPLLSFVLIHKPNIFLGS